MANATTLMNPRDVLLNVTVDNQQQLFELVANHIFQHHGVPFQYTLNALLRREQLSSTAIGNGVAIPHARVAELDRVYIVYVRLAETIPYLTPDGVPVRDVLALLVPNPAVDEHLAILSHIAKAFSQPKFCRELDECTQQKDVAALFCESEIGYAL